jgi:tetratricopeptide (TPR) repeat protein
MKRAIRVTPYGILAAGVLAAGMLAAFPGASAQEHEEFKNLKVLPKGISQQELRTIMGQFTRALGVRCSACHAAKPGEQHLDFALDDKPEKKTARVMMEMTRELNEKYIATLEDHSNPPIQVQCVTCHRGISHPRPLSDVLKLAYARGGIDSTRSRYAALRDRYYGSAAYDFGEVPLSDVALALADSEHVVDAANLLALNVEMNPKSAFAQRQAAAGGVLLAFYGQGGDSGVAVYQRSKAQMGQPREQEGTIANIGERLTRWGKTDAAIAALKLNTTEHPQSGDAFYDLGGAYLKRGGKQDKKLAIDAYLTTVSLDSTNTDAVKQLESLKVSKGKIEKARSGRP